jgi:hypothetical protein
VKLLTDDEIAYLRSLFSQTQETPMMETQAHQSSQTQYGRNEPLYGRQMSNGHNGRLDSALTRWQHGIQQLSTINEQWEQFANHLMGEVPTSASIAKLANQDLGPIPLAQAIERECDRFEQQLVRQQEVFKRLSQL